jgi:tight adherence protein C
MEIMNTLITGLGLLILGAGFIIVSLRWFNSDDVSQRIENFVADSEGASADWRARKMVERREFTGSFASRTLIPFFRRLIQFLGRLTPMGTIEGIGKQLVIAGHPYGLGPREFYGIRVLLTLLGFVLAYIVVIRRGFSTINLLLALGVFLLCVLLPVLWLRTRVSRRQKLIQRQLPDALDMLSVCATAGLGFDQSLQRVSEFWKSELSTELARTISEMEMGLSRAEALRNLSNRLDVSELSSFVTLILQADQLGMSIADTLQAQAEQMRVERHFRAEEQARKIPIKMLIPMAFLIFPAILAVILGPAIPDLIGFFVDFGG